jgi:hypothetical protein
MMAISNKSNELKMQSTRRPHFVIMFTDTANTVNIAFYGNNKLTQQNSLSKTCRVILVIMFE